MCIYAAIVCCQSCYKIKKNSVWKRRFKIQALKELEAYKNSEILFLYEDQVEDFFILIEEWSAICLDCEGNMPMLEKKIRQFLFSNYSDSLSNDKVKVPRQEKVKKKIDNVIYLSDLKK